MDNVRNYKHENGFSAKLYGKSSMSIYDAEGNEVMHTGFRKPNTEEEVMELLEEMPEFLRMILPIYNDDDLECDI